MPDGYFESVLTGSNRIADPALAAYYDDIREVTRGAAVHAAALAAIVELNTHPAWPGGGDAAMG